MNPLWRLKRSGRYVWVEERPQQRRHVWRQYDGRQVLLVLWSPGSPIETAMTKFLSGLTPADLRQYRVVVLKTRSLYPEDDITVYGKVATRIQDFLATEVFRGGRPRPIVLYSISAASPFAQRFCLDYRHLVERCVFGAFGTSFRPEFVDLCRGSEPRSMRLVDFPVEREVPSRIPQWWHSQIVQLSTAFWLPGFSEVQLPVTAFVAKRDRVMSVDPSKIPPRSKVVEMDGFGHRFDADGRTMYQECLRRFLELDSDQRHGERGMIPAAKLTLAKL